jgi:hypothetical protein
MKNVVKYVADRFSIEQITVFFICLIASVLSIIWFGWFYFLRYFFAVLTYVLIIYTIMDAYMAWAHKQKTYWIWQLVASIAIVIISYFLMGSIKPVVKNIAVSFSLGVFLTYSASHYKG